MNRYAEVVVPVLWWLLAAAVAAGVLAVAFGAWRVRAGKGTRKLPPRAMAVVLGEYAARARQRLAAAFRDSEYEDDAPEITYTCLRCGAERDDGVLRCARCDQADDQHRPGTGSPAGPVPSTGDLEHEPTEAEELAFLQAIRDDDPPRVMAAAKVQGTWLPLTGEPSVNPWINPAFAEEVMSLDAAEQCARSSWMPDDVLRRRSDGRSAVVGVPRPGERPPGSEVTGPGRPGFWPMPLAWGQEDVRRTMARDHDDTDIISQPRVVARRDVATRPYGFDHMLRSAPLRQLEAGVW